MNQYFEKLNPALTLVKVAGNHAVAKLPNGRYEVVYASKYGHTASFGIGYSTVDDAITGWATYSLATAVALGLKKAPEGMVIRDGTPGVMVTRSYPSQWTGSYGSVTFTPAACRYTDERPDPRRLRRILRSLPKAPPIKSGKPKRKGPTNLSS